MSAVITIEAAALEYHGRGWKPVPTSRKTRKALGTAWQKTPFSPHQFNGNAQNVAVQLGAVSGGLVDVDLDAEIAMVLAPEFLPPTEVVFGRKSKPCSHQLYVSDLCETENAAVIPYQEHVGGKLGPMIVELRIGGGGKGALTTLPPSMHVTGEMVQWVSKGDPAPVPGDVLKASVRKLAVATLLVRHYPADTGSGSQSVRHEAALVIGGVLARAGWAKDDIEHVVEAAARNAQDSEWRDRARTAAGAVEVKTNGRAVSGLSRCRDVWGEVVATTLGKWLRIRDDAEANETEPEAPPSPWLFHDDVDPQPTAWLIKNLLPETGAGLIPGQWGTYKTTIALELSVSVMNGVPFADKFMVKRRGGVAYLAAEGKAGLNSRLTTIARNRGVTGKLPFAYRPDCPPLTAPGALDKLAALIADAAKELNDRFGVPLVLVFVDTIVTAAGYTKAGDDNDTAITQRIMSVLAGLSQRFDLLALGLDHFGKEIATGTRGSSAKEGAADVVLALLGDREVNGTVTNTRLAVRKQRDGVSGLELPFTPTAKETGSLDEDGEPITYTVIDWQPAMATQTNDWRSKSPAVHLLRQVLTNTLVDGVQVQPFADGPSVRAIDETIVRAEFCKQYVAEGDKRQKDATRRSAFNRAIKTAQAAKLISIREINGAQMVWLAAND